MKVFIAIASLLFSVSAFAAAPEVSCELMYNKTDATGASVEFTRGQSVQVTKAGATASTKEFNLSAMLNQVCPRGAARCADVYTLDVIVSKGKIQSLLSVAVSTAKAGERFSTGLSIESESATVNCDVK